MPKLPTDEFIEWLIETFVDPEEIDEYVKAAKDFEEFCDMVEDEVLAKATYGWEGIDAAFNEPVGRAFLGKLWVEHGGAPSAVPPAVAPPIPTAPPAAPPAVPAKPPEVKPAPPPTAPPPKKGITDVIKDTVKKVTDTIKRILGRGGK